MNLAGKKIGIVGLGSTGIACLEYLHKQNQIIFFDDNLQHAHKVSLLYGQNLLAPLEDPRWQEIQYLLVSPGVPLHFPQKHQILSITKQAQIISDIELFCAMHHKAKIAAITGTNGKSTTVSLLASIMLEHDYLLGGNIGTPCLKLAKAGGYILELSSFQLDLLQNFKPNIAAITNITPDHLERYPSMESYISSKLSIARNMNKDDYLIINIDDAILKTKISSFAHTNLITISAKQQADIYWQDGYIIDATEKYAFNPTIALAGEHNLQNTLIAYSAAKTAGIAPETILAKIQAFPGLIHRMQYIKTYKNIAFYNDSKATNAQAASCALKALDNIFWLAGGIEKFGGIKTISNLLTKVRKAYFFGQDGANLAKQASPFTEVVLSSTMQEAFKMALEDGQNFGQKCNILLSPACASLDQFKNFEDRGQQFIQLIKNLT